MFLLNGQPLAIDTPFQDKDGNSYPANWLRLATLEEKEAIGISEVADEDTSFDNRFYWAKDLPKALEDKAEVNENNEPILDNDGVQIITKGLKSNFIAQIKAAAGSILAQTDWVITRKAEIGTEVPSEIAIYRAAIRVKADELESAITAVTTVEALSALDLSYPSK